MENIKDPFAHDDTDLVRREKGKARWEEMDELKSSRLQPNAPFKVTEIIRPKPITKLRGTPSFALGVIHHCGREIPIVDVRLKLGMEATECSEETRVVVLHIDNVEMGLLVDQVGAKVI